MPDGNSGSDIIVTGRLLPGYFFTSGGSGSEPAPGTGIRDTDTLEDNPKQPPEDPGEPSNPPQLPPGIYEEVIHDTGFSGNAVRAFKSAIAQIHQKLANSLANTTVTTKDNKTVTLGDVYSNWLNLTFQITSTKVYPPGYAGGTTRSDESGHLSQIDQHLAVENNFALQGGDGLYWLALHELSHTIPAADNFLHDKFNSYIARAGDASTWGKYTPEFKDVEIYTNYLERQIANAIGVRTLVNPPLGD